MSVALPATQTEDCLLRVLALLSASWPCSAAEFGLAWPPWWEGEALAEAAAEEEDAAAAAAAAAAATEWRDPVDRESEAEEGGGIRDPGLGMPPPPPPPPAADSPAPPRDRWWNGEDGGALLCASGAAPAQAPCCFLRSWLSRESCAARMALFTMRCCFFFSGDG